MALTVQISKNFEWEKATLIGSINEDAEVHLGSLVGNLGKQVIINFSQVTNVNSCGVRAWINFMRDLQKDRKLIFEECTPEIINQINMIPNFRGSADIQSLFGGFTCQSCGNHQNVLFKKGLNLPVSIGDGLPEVKCEKCSSKMELDELEEEYFAWMDAA